MRYDLFATRIARFVSRVSGAVTSLGTMRVTALLFAMSFAARAVFLLAVEGVNSPLEGDEPHYHMIAESFLRGTGWGIPGGDISYRPPLISFQLSIAYSVFGVDPAVARWTMVFFGSLVAPLLFLLAARLGTGTLMAAMAGLAWVFYPPAIWYSAIPLTETTAALLSVAGVLAFVAAGSGSSRLAAAVAGVCWALAALNRPVFILLPVIMLMSQMLLARKLRNGWKWSAGQWGVGLAAFVLVMAPWTVRNYVVHGVFMPTTSGSGWLMLMSDGTLSHPAIQQGAYYKNPELMAIQAAAGTEAARDSKGRELAWQEIRKNWKLLPTPLMNRAKNFWTPRPDPYDPSLTRNDMIMYVVWVPVLVGFVLLPTQRSWTRHWPVLATIVLAFLTTLPFWSSPRFRFPVDPLVVIMSAVGWVAALHRLAKNGRPGRIPLPDRGRGPSDSR